jgi:hypothetical protein
MQRLEEGRLELSRRRQSLIDRKRTFHNDWFRREQARLSAQQGAIQQAIGIGYSLGDAHAWYFYQFDRLLLEQHAAHNRQKQPTTSVGGLGEIAVLETLLQVGHYIPLYHGVTTILRVGDISLVELKPWRVVAIGEIKTTAPVSEWANSTVTFTGHREDFSVEDFNRRLHALNRQRRAKSKNRRKHEPGHGAWNPDQAPLEAKRRFQRQLDRTKASLHASRRVPDGESELLAEMTPLTRLEEAARATRLGRLQFQMVDDGLMVLTHRSRARSLFRLLTSTESITSADLPAEVESLFQQTVVPGSQWNGLLFGQLQYDDDGLPTLPHGSVPVPWWYVAPDVTRDIVFRMLTVSTVWNPAKLVARLEAAGFTVTSDTFPQKLVLSFQRGERTWSYVDPNFATRIPGTLSRAADWVEGIKRLAEHAQLDENRGKRIDMHTVHEYFSQVAVASVRRDRKARKKDRSSRR